MDTTPTANTEPPRAPAHHFTVVLFPGFELLDVFGPVELLSFVPEAQIAFAGPNAGPVRSSQGVTVNAEAGYADVHDFDVLMIPGGAGTRMLVHDAEFLRWLRGAAANATLVATVCTGSALLAAAGALDGCRATSNKRAFRWASSHGTDVDWQAQARWVADRDRWTSSGVAAGMDMTAALIAALFGAEASERACLAAEYSPQRDANIDPFAGEYRLR